MLFKRILLACCLLFLGALIFILSLYIALPTILENELKKRVPLPEALSALDFKVKKIGLSNACITDVRLSDGVRIDRVDAVYAVKRTGKVVFQDLTLAGLQVAAKADKTGKIQLQGLVLPPEKGDKGGGTDLEGIFAYLPGRVVVHSSTVSLDVNGRSLLLPFSAVSRVDAGQRKAVSRVQFFFAGEPVDAAVDWDFRKARGDVELAADHLDLHRLVAMAGIDAGQLPAGLGMEKLTAQVQLGEKNSSFKAGLTVLAPEGVQIPFDLQGAVAWEKDPTFDVQAATGKINTVDYRTKGIHAGLAGPWIKFSLKGDPRTVKISGTAGWHSCTVEKQREQHLFFGQSRLTWQTAVDFKNRKNQYQTHFQGKLGRTRLASGTAQGSMPGIDMKGALGLDHAFHPSMDLSFTFGNGVLEMPDHQIRAAGIKAVLPFSYPFEKAGGTGQVEILNFSFGDHSAALTCEVRQTESRRFELHGRVTPEKIESVSVLWDADLRMEEELAAAVNFTIPEFPFSEKTLAAAGMAQAKNILMQADLSAHGNVTARGSRISSQMQVHMKNGSVSMGDANLDITGIETQMAFDDLVRLHSVPGQEVKIDRVKIKDVMVENAKIVLSVETPESLLVENIRFNWCGGLVTTEAIRFPRRDRIYALSLYCDRLQMAQLLEQIGAFEAQGSGTLNGRIPVVYKDGEISFDNGFLFSTPGSGGKIIVKEADVLTVGIPLDSPQFSELDLAREALRDFDYEWAKLEFNTDQETLYVKMEMDGKPARILPFEYQRQAGRFVRVGAKSPGSDFKGIKLNVNLNLPFNRVMKFGNKLKSVFE